MNETIYIIIINQFTSFHHSKFQLPVNYQLVANKPRARLSYDFRVLSRLPLVGLVGWDYIALLRPQITTEHSKIFTITFVCSLVGCSRFRSLYHNRIWFPFQSKTIILASTKRRHNDKIKSFKNCFPDEKTKCGIFNLISLKLISTARF